jgi:hypothetical protein
MHRGYKKQRGSGVLQMRKGEGAVGEGGEKVKKSWENQGL